VSYDEVQAEVVAKKEGHETFFKVRIYSPVARKVVFTNDGLAFASLDSARNCVVDWALGHARKVQWCYVDC